MVFYVSALAAEWIEILPVPGAAGDYASPPSRRSGLKYFGRCVCHLYITVSALAAEWIEISPLRYNGKHISVSALAAEWIEIWQSFGARGPQPSPPSRRSGLKLPSFLMPRLSGQVSALAAEWIEIGPVPRLHQSAHCLRPRGGVD